MLRALLVAFALAAPSAAWEQFAPSPLGLEVRGHDGAVVGRVSAVERNADGEIVAVEIPGLEPPDAPRAREVAEETWRWGWTRTEAEAPRG